MSFEDIIGLKIQAAVNDPCRKTADWADIRLMIETAAADDCPLDWALIGDYLDIFDLGTELTAMRTWHGKTD